MGILAVLLALSLFVSCNSDVNNKAAEGADKGGSGGSNYWKESLTEETKDQQTEKITDINVKYSDFDQETSSGENPCKIEFKSNTAQINGNGAEIVQGDFVMVKITSAGKYVISGETDNGQIYVEAGENQVHLILNGVKIHCEKSAPIYLNNGKKTVITLADNTVNELTDGKNYEYSVTETDETTGETKYEPNAALFSKKALTINGNGSLEVVSKNNNGIGCKDELKIMSGNIKVQAVNNAIRGNDFVVIKDGEIAAVSESGDGIKSTKEDNAEKGFVYIEGGNINVEAYEDALQAVTLLAVKGGNLTLSADDDGMHCDNTLLITGGETHILKSYEGIEAKVINISGGKTYVKANDDGLNSTAGNNTDWNNNAQQQSTENSGGFTGVGFSGGRPEGGNRPDFGDRMPGTMPEDGNMPEGVNPFDGGFGGGFGGGSMQYNSECKINISGGYLYVDADGDGVDSNGDLTASGGTVIVNGPTNNGNGALDANGTILVNGGFLVAVGSSGMAEYPAGTSAQNVITVTLSSKQQAGSVLRIEEETGADLLNFASAKSYNSIVFSSPDIKNGKTYTVYAGGEYSGGEENDGLMANGTFSGGTSAGSVTVSQIVSNIGNGGGGMFGGGQRPKNVNNK